MTDKPYPWLRPLEENRAAAPVHDVGHEPGRVARPAHNPQPPVTESEVGAEGEQISAHPRPLPTRDNEPLASGRPISPTPHPHRVPESVSGYSEPQSAAPVAPASVTSPAGESLRPPRRVGEQGEATSTRQRQGSSGAAPQSTPTPPDSSPSSASLRPSPSTIPLEFAVARDVLRDILNIVKNNPLTWALGMYISAAVAVVALAPFFILFLREFYYSLMWALLGGSGSLVGFLFRNLLYFFLVFLVSGVLYSCFLALVVRGQLHELNGRKLTLATFFQLDQELKNTLKAVLPVYVPLFLVGVFLAPLMLLTWFLGFVAHFGATRQLSFRAAVRASWRLTTRNIGVVGISYMLIWIPISVVPIFILTILDLGSVGIGMADSVGTQVFLGFIFFLLLPPVLFINAGMYTSLYLRIEHGNLGEKVRLDD